MKRAKKTEEKTINIQGLDSVFCLPLLFDYNSKICNFKSKKKPMKEEEEEFVCMVVESKENQTRLSFLNVIEKEKRKIVIDRCHTHTHTNE